MKSEKLQLKNNTWQKVKLGDVVEIVDGDRGKNYPGKEEFSNSGYCVFLDAKNVFGAEFNLNDAQFITKEKDQALRKGKLKRNDFVLTTRGTIGNVAHYGKDIKFDNIRINSGMVILRPKNNVIDEKFFDLYLISQEFKNQIEALKSGSAQPQLPIRDLKSFEINLPSLKEQKDIVNILWPIKNKIELNNKISKNLEQTAQAIFKEWFVHFKFPGHKKEKMVDSELGKIPEGWGVKSWGDLEGVSAAGDWGEGISSDVCAESVYILRGTDIPALKAGSKGECPIRYLAKESLQKRRLNPGDIVVEISGGSKDQPTGRSLYITEDILKRFELPLVCTSFCRLVRSNSMLSSILMFLHLDWLYKTKKIWNYQLQSTGISNFQYGQFREYEKLIVPLPEIQEKVSNVLISCIQYSHRNENQKLAALRDFLLPKLMSGRIKI